MNRMQRSFLKLALQNLHKLDDWERDFVRKLSTRGDEYELSEKQNSKLNKINSRVVS